MLMGRWNPIHSQTHSWDGGINIIYHNNVDSAPNQCQAITCSRYDAMIKQARHVQYSNCLHSKLALQAGKLTKLQ